MWSPGIGSVSEVVSSRSNTILGAIRQGSPKAAPRQARIPFGAPPLHSIRAWRGASPAIIIVAGPAILIVAGDVVVIVISCAIVATPVLVP